MVPPKYEEDVISQY